MFLHRNAFLLVILAIVILGVTLVSGSAKGVTGTTLDFEYQGLDLDTGSIANNEGSGNLFIDNPDVDVRVSYHSESSPSSILVHNYFWGATIAFLADTDYETVSAEDISGMTFSQTIVPQPFSPNDTIVIHTDTGAYYKLGYPVENETSLTFEYGLLQETSSAGVPPVGGPASTKNLGGPNSSGRGYSNSPGETPSGLNSSEWNQIRSQIPELRIANVMEFSGVRLVSLSIAVGSIAALALILFGIPNGRWQIRRLTPVRVMAASAASLVLLLAAPMGLSTTSVTYASTYLPFGQNAKLVPNDAAAGDIVGISVAVSGTTVIVGASRTDWIDPAPEPMENPLKSNAGAAYVFVKDASGWVLQQKLLSDDPATLDEFGVAVAIEGDTALVGARWDDGSNFGEMNAGAVYAFNRVVDITNPTGYGWELEQRFTAMDSGPQVEGADFGSSVALSGNSAIVGSPFFNVTYPPEFIFLPYPPFFLFKSTEGAAYIFTRSGSTWSQEARLTSSDPVIFDWFGHSVDIDTDTAVVGAPKSDGSFPTPGPGSAHVFTRIGTSWTLQQELSGDVPEPFDDFGSAVSISDDTIAVGAGGDNDNSLGESGSVYIYTRAGAIWSQEAKLHPDMPEADTFFGSSVSLDGDRIAIGANLENDNGSDSGGIYVFIRTGSTWDQDQHLLASDGDEFDQFGTSISLDGDTIAVGANFNDDNGPDTGAAYIFMPNEPPVVDFGIGTSAIADEGDTAASLGTFSDPEGDYPVVLSASIGVITQDDTLRTWSWSYDTTDGPDDGQTVTITAVDSVGSESETSFDLNVLNIAPTIALSGDATVDEGSLYTLLLGNVVDPGNDMVTSYVVNWGDGDTAPDNAPIPGTANHIYGDNGNPVTIDIDLTDEDGTHTSAGSLDITVNNVAPSITSLNLDSAVINEGDSVTLIGEFDDPGFLDTHTVTITWGDGDSTVVSLPFGARSFSESHQYLDDNPSGTPSDNYTIQVQVSDDDGGDSAIEGTGVTVNNVAPVIGPITAPIDPVEIDSTIAASATFSDVGSEDTHTAEFDWGDGSTSAGTISGYDVNGSHTYTATGVYTLTLTITDDDTGATSELFQYVVVYDPNGGFVTGGGWIDSPEGAYAADPTLTGRANFGFNSKYKKGQSVPDGNTNFHFNTGDLHFRSTSYEWLVIAGHNAKYKGEGIVNGSGNYGFMLTATDEKLTPSTDDDLFRIKIWDKDNNDAVVYDNQMGASDDSEDGTAIGGGSIVIHKGKK